MLQKQPSIAYNSLYFCRVLLFQARFDELWRKYEVYSSGEKLFGMTVNEYPILVERKKQFNLLQKLYGLYLVVNKAIDGYFELAWQDVNIEEIMTELVDFQNRFVISTWFNVGYVCYILFKILLCIDRVFKIDQTVFQTREGKPLQSACESKYRLQMHLYTKSHVYSRFY